ncbi:3alpha(or 20beta)-hydroxysteroid dehydrogenase/3-oxoacyl-[acyl-carrier protein] reductase [Breoghania corrubedonensis]|uniref:3alpha(Or 20beta)-hydroxysteroid dehydrogenase/3-oxoacyl-[acyl-carrier protein] reductase n=1 Tax=Breoghania corrubedonensis TaxID=665038 RepID=A0A2T5VE43_9HYPH|nr:SDR family oxidoreductase [Breoghania corrubedonensis]PTW62025.1 3alpha(or 20beta)-hydroxysteroid dehydrogenase/3-oxoacyl-[acyl-carrier protein] reductase [Breoghania corrubedonensis]
MSELSGKIVLITGAGGGIGAALSQCLYDEGASLVLQSADLEGLRAKAAKGGWDDARILLQAHDVTDGKAVEAAASEALARFGRIDMLVNLAGINRFGGVLTCPEEEWDRVMSTNVKGYFLAARAVVPAMKEAGAGCIVNVSSIWGVRGNAKMMAYSTSKHAVEGFTASLRADVASSGIKVSSLIVGIVDTPFREAMKDHVTFTDEQCAIMLQPVDVVAALRYMLSTSPNALVSSLTLEAWRLQ